MKFMLSWICVIAVWAGFASAQSGNAASTSSIAQNGLETLMVSKSSAGMLLKFGLREPLPSAPSNFSIANPARLVFDLPATENALGYSSKAINEGGLRSINVVQAGDRSRLVLNLDKVVRFETRLEGKALYISLLSDESVASAEGVAAPVQHFPGSAKAEGQSLRDIQFRRGKDGTGIVAVDLSSSDTPVDIVQKGSALIVSFKKTKLPENLRRQLDVVDFATPITSVKTRAVGEDVGMEIVPKGLWEHTAFQSDNQFIVEVRPVKEDPHKLFQGSKTGYQGEVISLNFQNIPLRELLHVFADITNFNIVVSDSVSGNVSLRLNDVPWDHALEIVLQQKSLSMRKSGNVLWIAPRDELAARDKLEVDAREAAVAAETPRLEVFQLNYQKAEDFAKMLVSGTAASSDAKGSTQGALLSAIGRVTVDKRTNQAFIYDVPSKLDLVRDLLTKVDRPARQVLIEARIVEADTTFSKALGARLGMHDHYGLDQGRTLLGTGARYGVSASSVDAYTHLAERRTMTDELGNVTAVATGTQLIAPTTYIESGQYKRETVAPTIADSQISNNAVSNPTGQFAFTLFNRAKTLLLTLELTALEADGMGKTISSPRVLTADQVEATIHDGERIPYLAASSSGATAIQWIDATLSLKVKPQITPDSRVQMSIKINKDSRGTQVGLGGIGTMPSIKTKEIISEVHIDNGGTVVIGGVFEMSESESTSRVPFFGDLPYVGFMFKKKEKYENKKELIIMLTPRIADSAVNIRL